MRRLFKRSPLETTTKRQAWSCEVCSEQPAKHMYIEDTQGTLCGAMLCRKCIRQNRKSIRFYTG